MSLMSNPQIHNNEQISKKIKKNNKKMIKAEIITDSVNVCGNRLTTFVLNFPRIVLAEFNTHRALSRNSASSRAIPFEKMVTMVKENPFIPIRFQKDHKGMQGTEYFEGTEHHQCVFDWLEARNAAVAAAINFKLPVTKQIRNRILEPYMWHKVIMTASDMENFFALRAHGDAEIHIAKLAELMLEEYNKSEPKLLQPGKWHIPFGDIFDEDRLHEAYKEFGNPNNNYEDDIEDLKRKISTARCARISYLNFEGKDNYIADIKMCDRLFGSIPKHLSPAEHVAQALGEPKRVGNFQGYKQLRKFFADENLRDPRVKSIAI